MKHRDALKAAVRNVQAIRWAKNHTLQDLEDLVNEMSSLGEDVTDISQLLNDLSEIDRSLQADMSVSLEPEASEIAG
jgi:predicted  nucleic acid-binding Zn-ribbon protein